VKGELSARHPAAWRGKPSEARSSGRYSNEWLFSDGIDGVKSTLFKLHAKPSRR
jgi:hypothetical protein